MRKQKIYQIKVHLNVSVRFECIPKSTEFMYSIAGNFHSKCRQTATREASVSREIENLHSECNFS